MTPLQKNILAACKHRPQTLRELQNALQVDNSRLRNTVTGMVATGMLSARNGTYVPGFAVMENTDAPAGIPCTLVKLAARFGFASRDDGTGDIFIPGRALHGAMPQDKIIIKLFDHPRVEGSAEGEVVEVTTPHNTFAGTIVLTEDDEVVNGIAPLEKRPKMAIIPGGTTNDYARALKIPRDNVREAAKVVLKNQTIKMDIGKAADSYFINIAAGGHLTELTYEVPTELKSIFGYLAYLAKGAELLPRIKPIPMHLKYDDGVYDGNASMFFLGLTNSVGGFEQIVPDAKLDDGKFSLIIVKTAKVFEILHLVGLLINGGKHVNDRRIIYTKTSKLEVNLPDPNKRLMINLDGEYGGVAPMTFENFHNHIEFYGDLDAIPNQAVIGNAYEEVSKEFLEEVERLQESEFESPIEE